VGIGVEGASGVPAENGVAVEKVPESLCRSGSERGLDGLTGGFFKSGSAQGMLGERRFEPPPQKIEALRSYIISRMGAAEQL
jgi:hypothetical protein